MQITKKKRTKTFQTSIKKCRQQKDFSNRKKTSKIRRKNYTTRSKNFFHIDNYRDVEYSHKKITKHSFQILKKVEFQKPL